MGENALFRILSERPMSVSELARRLNVRREYLGGYLEALRDSGKLERIKVGRSYVYLPKAGAVADDFACDMFDAPSRPTLLSMNEEEEE